MLTIRQVLLLLAIALTTLAMYAAANEEGAPPPTKTGTAEEKSGPGKDGKKRPMNPDLEKIRETMKTFDEARREFIKSEMEKFRTFAEGMKGKDGAEISPALTTFYIQQYADSKAFLEKQNTEITAAVKALEVAEEFKTKALERLANHYKELLAGLEERQKDRLVFAKSLSSLTAEEVAIAVKNRREEMRIEMKKKQEEMQKKQAEMQKKHEEMRKKGASGKGADVPPPPPGEKEGADEGGL